MLHYMAFFILRTRSFSYLLLANYSDLSPHVADMLFSKGAFIFFITAFNILGSYFNVAAQFMVKQSIRIEYPQTLENYYHLYSVTLLFFLLNYSLLIVGKLLVGSYNIFIFPNGGWRILFLVWLVELVIVGLLLYLTVLFRTH